MGLTLLVVTLWLSLANGQSSGTITLPSYCLQRGATACFDLTLPRSTLQLGGDVNIFYVENNSTRSPAMFDLLNHPGSIGPKVARGNPPLDESVRKTPNASLKFPGNRGVWSLARASYIYANASAPTSVSFAYMRQWMYYLYDSGTVSVLQYQNALMYKKGVEQIAVAWKPPDTYCQESSNKLHRKLLSNHVVDYAMYVAAALRHLIGVGLQIQYVELVNEPDGDWGAYIDPYMYNDLVVKTKALLESTGDPSTMAVKIIGPGLSQMASKQVGGADGYDYLWALTKNSQYGSKTGIESLGGFSMHAWDTVYEPELGIAYLDATFRQFNLARVDIAGHLPFMLTEWGVKSAAVRNTPNPNCNAYWFKSCYTAWIHSPYGTDSCKQGVPTCASYPGLDGAPGQSAHVQEFKDTQDLHPLYDLRLFANLLVAINNGVTSAVFWTLYDQGYYDAKRTATFGNNAGFGLFDREDRAKPCFFILTMITRYLSANSDGKGGLPTVVPRVWADTHFVTSGIVSSDGTKLVIAMANMEPNAHRKRVYLLPTAPKGIVYSAVYQAGNSTRPNPSSGYVFNKIGDICEVKFPNAVPSFTFAFASSGTQIVAKQDPATMKWYLEANLPGGCAFVAVVDLNMSEQPEHSNKHVHMNGVLAETCYANCEMAKGLPSCV